MSKFIIQGGQKLHGEIEVMGMKNAATPILAATLLTQETCLIHNIPRISDVEKMIDILKSLGSQIEWTAEHSLKITNQDVGFNELNQKAIKQMRSSILLLGPMMARFHEVDVPEPGGCIIGKRSIDTHLYVLEKLGAEINQVKDIIHLRSTSLKGNYIVLPEFSVTATENAIMAAVLAQGKTTIKLAAAEPHVQDLCLFLNNMGAQISGIGTHTLEIQGVEKLKGTEYTIIPDQIEAGTFMVMAALTAGKVKIKNIIPEHLELIFLKMKEIGINFKIGEDYVEIEPTLKLQGFKLQTMPYPGFPTDLQAPFGALATQCQGTTLIQETMYEGRFNYVQELIKMGANAIVADPHRIIVTGPTPLYGQEIKSFDLRAGATLIIAGLIADGETIINEAENVDRGYENIAERLQKLGAQIERVE
ncbi:MAG: UDP-N-acetylglucosamine 1-carboxyvinyltransferase [Patescibacteria group bacterium]|nr:UDP-N-acetylglucosamine 1-carboxyvinyltransferase [Patescibacteria group bacterium]